MNITDYAFYNTQTDMWFRAVRPLGDGSPWVNMEEGIALYQEDDIADVIVSLIDNHWVSFSEVQHIVVVPLEFNDNESLANVDFRQAINVLNWKRE